MPRHVARATTLGLIRHLHALRVPGVPAPRRRVGRWPRPLPPTNAENGYTAALHRAVCDLARECMEREIPEILHALVLLRREQGRLDHSDAEVPGGQVTQRGRSRRDKLGDRVALVLAFDELGRLLLGRRRDTGRWTMPGGHLEPGERPRRGAARELEEETNLTTAALDLVEELTNPDATRLWVYRCQVRGKPTGYFDPDQECSEWRFFDVTDGLPPEVAAMVSGPVDPEHNVLLRLFPPHRADARAPRGRGAAIGAGRAAQLGAKAAAEEAAKLKAKAREMGEELRRAGDQGKRAAAAIDRAARAFVEEFNPRALHAVVAQFGKATDQHSREQLDRQLRSAIGVPLSALERPHRDKLDEWAAVNVDLIKTVPERYFDRIRLDVLDAFEGGTHPSTLAEELSERFDMSERDAERIARDQVLSLSADLNQQRMTDLGVERYAWRDAGDGRVRDNHADLAARSDAGETFSFDDPPLGGGTSEEEEGNPGDGILCRCYPDPVLDDLING